MPFPRMSGAFFSPVEKKTQEQEKTGENHPMSEVEESRADEERRNSEDADAAEGD